MSFALLFNEILIFPYYCYLTLHITLILTIFYSVLRLNNKLARKEALARHESERYFNQNSWVTNELERLSKRDKGGRTMEIFLKFKSTNSFWRECTVVTDNEEHSGWVRDLCFQKEARSRHGEEFFRRLNDVQIDRGNFSRKLTPDACETRKDFYAKFLLMLWRQLPC